MNMPVIIVGLNSMHGSQLSLMPKLYALFVEVRLKGNTQLLIFPLAGCSVIDASMRSGGRRMNLWEMFKGIKYACSCRT